MYVYLITNKINGKIYVGQHGGDDLDWYFQENIKSAMRGSNRKRLLYRAIRKYGLESFTIEPIAYPLDKDQMDSFEIFYIAWLKSKNIEIGYNLTDGGEGQLGAIVSEETKEKLRLIGLKTGISLKCREAQKEYLKHRVFTTEHREKLRQAKLGKRPTEETRQKQSLAKLGRIPWNKGIKTGPRK